MASLEATSTSSLDSFVFGLKEGYNTFDIFGAFMFSGVILNSIKSAFGNRNLSQKELLVINLKASSIGLSL